MSVSYRINENVLRFDFAGGTPSKEIYAQIHFAYEDPACPPDAAILMDVRASTSLESRSIGILKALSQFIVEHPRRPGQRIAILLEPEEKERLTPLATELVQETGLAISLFDIEHEALQWLAAGGAVA